MIYLGQFKELEDAVQAWKEAEEKYYKPILEKSGSYGVKPRLEKLDSGALDLTGQQYPHFRVVRYGGMGKHKSRLWVCKCECGKTFIATSSDIHQHKVSSCGCVHEEKEKITKPILQCHCIMADGTNLTKIAEKKPDKNNRSGTRGIYQDRCGTWHDKTVLRGVEHRIRCTSKLQAIYRRKELEMEYFDPILKEHKKLLEKKNTRKGK